MATSPYLRRPLRSYAEAAAERRPRHAPVEKPPGAPPDRPDGEPAKAASPAEAGDD